MDDNLTLALLITVTGMGLVFGAILLFAMLTGLLAHLTSNPAKGESEDVALDPMERELKRRAATAAVAAALAQEAARSAPADGSGKHLASGHAGQASG